MRPAIIFPLSFALLLALAISSLKSGAIHAPPARLVLDSSNGQNSRCGEIVYSNYRYPVRIEFFLTRFQDPQSSYRILRAYFEPKEEWDIGLMSSGMYLGFVEIDETHALKFSEHWTPARSAILDLTDEFSRRQKIHYSSFMTGCCDLDGRIPCTVERGSPYFVAMFILHAKERLNLDVRVVEPKQ